MSFSKSRLRLISLFFTMFQQASSLDEQAEVYENIIVFAQCPHHEHPEVPHLKRQKYLDIRRPLLRLVLLAWP